MPGPPVARPRLRVAAGTGRRGAVVAQRTGTIAQMCQPVAIVDPESWTAGQGLGLQTWRRGERVYIGHTGSMPGYLAVLAVHRATRTGVVMFANAYTLAWQGNRYPDS